MPHSGRFTRAEIEPYPWLGPRLGRIADYCEGAELTMLQGRAVLLYCMGLPRRQMARALERDRRNVQRALDDAARKIERAYPRFRQRVPPAGWFWALMWCLRNRSEGSGRPMCSQRSDGEWREHGRPQLVLPEDLRRPEALEALAKEA